MRYFRSMDYASVARDPLFKWRLFDALGYRPRHAEVSRFHESKARIKLAVCPARSSKSYSAAKDVLPDLFVPGCRGWIVGPNYTLAEKEFRYIHDDLVVKGVRDFGLPRPQRVSTIAKSGGLFIKWGAPLNVTIEAKTAENPQTLLGEEVDFIIYSEAAQLPRAIHEKYCYPRTITKQGRIIIPTTPESKAEWLYDMWDKGRSGNDERIDTFTWDVTANPAYRIEEFEWAKNFYGEDHPAFREQFLGEWVFYTGLVYPSFSKDMHIIDPFRIPQDWPKFRVIDFGSRDPFCCLWYAVGPNSEIYVYREYYERNPSVPSMQHAEAIRLRTASEHIQWTIADPSAKQLITDMAHFGVAPIRAADNDRTAGRVRVMEYLQPTEYGKPPYNHGKRPMGKTRWPKLYIFSDCVELIGEIKFYRWKESKAREGEKERTEGSDHAMDCLRYLCMDRPSPLKSLQLTPAGSFEWWAKHINPRNPKTGMIQNAY